MEELVLTLVRLYAPGQSALHPDLVRHGHAMDISWDISYWQDLSQMSGQLCPHIC